MHNILTFNSFIKESYLLSNYAPLYHATNTVFIGEILGRDMLLAAEQPHKKNGGFRRLDVKSTDVRNKQKLVCLTRDSELWYVPGIKFMLDQQKLKYDFKIRAFNYFDNEINYGTKLVSKHEFEESVFSDITPLSKYLIEIETHRLFFGRLTSNLNGIDADLLVMLNYIEKHPHVKLKINYPARYTGKVKYEYVTTFEDVMKMKNKLEDMKNSVKKRVV